MPEAYVDADLSISEDPTGWAKRVSKGKTEDEIRTLSNERQTAAKECRARSEQAQKRGDKQASAKWLHDAKINDKVSDELRKLASSSRKDSTTVDKLLAEADGLYHRSDALQNGTWSDIAADANYGESSDQLRRKIDELEEKLPHTKDKTARTKIIMRIRDMESELGSRKDSSRGDANGCTFILVDGKVDQVIQHTGNYKAIIEREVKDLKKMDAGRVTTKVFENEEQGYAKYDSVRGDADPRSMTLAQAKAEYARRHKKIEDQLRRDLDKASRSNVRDFGTAFNNDMKVKAQARFTQAENDLAKELLWWRPEYGGRKDSEPTRHISYAPGTPEYEADLRALNKMREKGDARIKEIMKRVPFKNEDARERDAIHAKIKAEAERIHKKWMDARSEAIRKTNETTRGRKDSEPTTLDALLSVADELYERSDAVARGDAHSPQPGDQVTIKKEAFERLRAGGYNGPRVVRVKEYRGSDLVLSNGQRVKPADVD